MSIYDRVLITGGGGMLAQALMHSLQSRGIQAIAPSHMELDVAKPEAFFPYVREIRPTLIFNCAAYTKVDAAEQNESVANAVNKLGAAHAARAASGLLGKVVHFSTDFVFDGQSERPYKPGDPVNPLSAYGRTKLGGEQVIINSDYCPIYLIIRTSWLYGPGGPNFVQTMLNAARAGKELSVVNDQIGSPTFTHDLAEATLDLVDKGACGTYHATNSGQTSWFDFAKAIFEEFGLSPELSPTTSLAWKESHPNSAIRPAYSVLDCSETERVIGRKMPDWRDALRRYHEIVEPK